MPGLGEVVDDVGSRHGDFGEGRGGHIACKAVNEYAEAGSIPSRIPLRAEAKQNACQHIAAAARCHACVASGVVRDFTGGGADSCAVPF